jgi:hypothetical protein
MLRWLFAGKIRNKIESDILDARSMLATMKLKLHKEGAQATVSYGEGVGQVAGLLAKRFGISVPAALEARGLDWKKLSDAADDLMAAMEQGRSLLKSDVQASRTAGHTHTFGCLILYHLYRLRFLATQVSGELKVEVTGMADRIAAFARLMAEIAVGVRDPSDAQA